MLSRKRIEGILWKWDCSSGQSLKPPTFVLDKTEVELSVLELFIFKPRHAWIATLAEAKYFFWKAAYGAVNLGNPGNCLHICHILEDFLKQKSKHRHKKNGALPPSKMMTKRFTEVHWAHLLPWASYMVLNHGHCTNLYLKLFQWRNYFTSTGIKRQNLHYTSGNIVTLFLSSLTPDVHRGASVAAARAFPEKPAKEQIQWCLTPPFSSSFP